MTIGRALQFISEGQQDTQLRSLLNQASSVMHLYDILDQQHLGFSPFDFEEAFHYRLRNCQKNEEKEQLQEFRAWWELLHRILAPDACEPLAECDSAAKCVARGYCKRVCG